MTEKNPWKTLGTRIAYQNPWLKVREDSVICPDGSPGTYAVVDAKPATGVIALTPDLQVYLIGQYRYATQCYSWEIIEGGVEVGEEPIEAAVRELAEEAGLVAKRWEPLGGELQLWNCYSSERTNLFLAQDLSQVERKPDFTEVLQVKTVPLKTALEMAESGAICDSMAIVGIMRAARKFHVF